MKSCFVCHHKTSNNFLSFLIFLKTVSGSFDCSGDVLSCQSQVKNPDDGHYCDEDIGEDKAEDNVRKGTS